jgi:anti-sigma-K factor RskA
MRERETSFGRTIIVAVATAAAGALAVYIVQRMTEKPKEDPWLLVSGEGPRELVNMFTPPRG